MKFDFHMHSVYSDGSTKVEEIFKQAKELGLKAISITDHDTVLGLEEVEKWSKEYDIPFIPAAEFTAIERGIKFHVLGYGIDYKSKELIDYSKGLLDKLNEKSKVQIGLMKERGIEIQEEEFFKEGQGGPLYRAKMLKVLSRYNYLEENEIMNSLEAYFSPSAPYYVEDNFEFYSFEKIINLIRNNKGIAVLAHPEQLKKRDEDLYWEVLNSSLLDGVEVYHWDNGQETREELLRFAKDKEIIITGGSDYHGDYNKLKTPIGGIEIPKGVYENLAPYLK